MNQNTETAKQNESQAAHTATTTADKKEGKQNSNTSAAPADQDQNTKGKSAQQSAPVFDMGENLKFLKNRLYYQGFREHLHDKLETAVKEGKPNFTLEHTAEFKGFGNRLRVVDYDVNFKRDKFVDSAGQNREQYSIDTMQATLRNDNNPAQSRSQTFHMSGSRGITSKEAFNMLEGRAVLKTVGTKNNPTNEWIKIDFDKPLENKPEFKVRTFSQEKYGFDLEKSLAKTGLSIKNFDIDSVKAQVMDSLERGNFTKLLLKNGDKESTAFAVADPANRSVMAWDENMVRIGQETKQFQGESREQFQARAQAQREGVTPTSDPATGKSAANDSTPKGKEAESTEKKSDMTVSKGTKENQQAETNVQVEGSRTRKARGHGV